MHLRKYLPGGLAPGVILNQHIQMLRQHLAGTDEGDNILDLYVVGLITYAETFYRSFLAASINMYPSLALKLKGNNKNKGIELSITLEDIFFYKLDLSKRIGFLLADKLRFDNADDINKNFSALLHYKPFSKGEIEKYQELKDHRNLLVHNSGIMNKRFIDSKPFYYEDEVNQTFYTTAKWQLEEGITFFEETSKRFLGIARGKIEQEIKNIRYKNEDWDALLERLCLWEPF